MAKKQKCPEFENHERWLVAFADMMTLLFALFVVLYSIANQDIEKLKKVSQSIQKAFNVEVTDNSGPPGEPKGNSLNEGIFNKIKGTTNRESMLKRSRREVTAIISSDSKKVEREIADRLYGSKEFPAAKSAQDSKKEDDRVVFVNRDADGIRITLLARKFFKPSETVLTGEAKFALDGISQSIKGLGRMIRIEGHTDNLPFNMNGMTNWELSTNRAAAVVRYLINKQKFNSQMIYAAGFADTHPVATNDTPANRALNRRVDIKILYENPSEYSQDSDDKKEQDTEKGTPAAPEKESDKSGQSGKSEKSAPKAPESKPSGEPEKPSEKH